MVSIWVFRRAIKKSRILAVCLVFLMLSTSALLWPIPIHGGFTILAEVMYSEWRSLVRQRERVRDERADTRFIQQTLNRFAGPINFEIVRTLQYGWAEVLTEGGTPGWTRPQAGPP